MKPDLLIWTIPQVKRQFPEDLYDRERLVTEMCRFKNMERNKDHYFERTVRAEALVDQLRKEIVRLKTNNKE